MGIILAIEAVVAIVEAAEAVAAAIAEAGEAITIAADAAEAIDAGASSGSEAGTAAGEEAAEAAAEGGDALSQVIAKFYQAIKKITRLVAEFVEINAVFKGAKAILDDLLSDPLAQARARKLEKLIDVLVETAKILQQITEWLKKHAEDMTTVNGYSLTIQAVLSSFIPRLGSGAAVLNKLASQVKKKNATKQPITDGEVEAVKKGLQAVLSSLKSLADFKEEHEAKIPQLESLPIGGGHILVQIINDLQAVN